jgi:hypothetical protein
MTFLGLEELVDDDFVPFASLQLHSRPLTQPLAHSLSCNLSKHYKKQSSEQLHKEAEQWQVAGEASPG